MLKRQRNGCQYRFSAKILSVVSNRSKEAFVKRKPLNYRTYAKLQNSIDGGAIGAVRKPHLPGKCVSPKLITILLIPFFGLEHSTNFHLVQLLK